MADHLMACEACGSTSLSVSDSRPYAHPVMGGTIRRRRDCEDCGHRYVTYEVSDAQLDLARGGRAEFPARMLLSAAKELVAVLEPKGVNHG